MVNTLLCPGRDSNPPTPIVSSQAFYMGAQRPCDRTCACALEKLSGKQHRLLTIIWYHVSRLPTQAISSLTAQFIKNKCVFVPEFQTVHSCECDIRVHWCLSFGLPPRRPHLFKYPFVRSPDALKQVDLLVSFSCPPTRRGLPVFPDCHLL